MEYGVVQENSAHELEKAVTELIAEGWVPQGGMAVMPETEDTMERYFQALIRRKKSENPVASQ
jgi:hypothetical protein